MDDEDHDLDRSIPRPDEINWSALRTALSSLQMFDDPYLQMQTTNLGIVDQFLTEIEYSVLEESFKDDKDPSGMFFLGAQSQMWMFSAYELLRTWRGRVRDTLKLLKEGEIQRRIDELLKDQGFRHSGREIRAVQLRRVMDNPDAQTLMEEDLRLTHILFKQLDHLRIGLAKHEVKGKRGSIALAPGYGRMDTWSGSIQYELEIGQISLGTLSRRNVADGIRAWLDRDIPSPDHIKSFDEFMRADAKNPFAERESG